MEVYTLRQVCNKWHRVDPERKHRLHGLARGLLVNTCESHLGIESRGEDRDEAAGPRNIHIRDGDKSEDKTGNLWAAASNQGMAER